MSCTCRGARRRRKSYLHDSLLSDTEDSVGTVGIMEPLAVASAGLLSIALAVHVPPAEEVTDLWALCHTHAPKSETTREGCPCA